MMNPDHAATIVNTGGAAITPAPTGTILAGNHRSHCTISPGRYSVRSAGSDGANNGRNTATRARNTDAECCHPIRSPITEAGIDGDAASNTRILAS